MLNVYYDVAHIQKQDNGYYKTYGNLLIDNGRTTVIFDANSGGYGKGTIPIGEYRLMKAIRLIDEEGNNPYKGEEFPWYASLEPLGNCDRTGLLIHPDGNIEGSLGCLVIDQGEDDCHAFHLLSVEEGVLTVC